MAQNINIQNKKAFFEYEVLERYTAGIQLGGTEIKSIRAGHAGIKDSYCEFNDRGELFVVNMYIKEWENAAYFNHQARARRKLLLTAQELKKLRRKVKDTGLTIIPLRLFINEKGWAKLEIALCRGKKKYDKRHAIKAKEDKRNLDRLHKQFLNKS